MDAPRDRHCGVEASVSKVNRCAASQQLTAIIRAITAVHHDVDRMGINLLAFLQSRVYVGELTGQSAVAIDSAAKLCLLRHKDALIRNAALWAAEKAFQLHHY